MAAPPSSPNAAVSVKISATPSTTAMINQMTHMSTAPTFLNRAKPNSVCSPPTGQHVNGYRVAHSA
jgi:hypothetical protein